MTTAVDGDRGLKTIATGLAIALALVSLSEAPAHAADGGYFSPTDQVLYDDCYDIQVPFTVSLPPNISEWTVSSSIIEPGGDTITDYADGNGNLGGGTMEAFTCGTESDLGTYLVSGYITGYDANYNKYTFSMPSTSFTMLAPATKTHLRVSDRTVEFNDPVTFRVKATGQSVRGYVGLDYTTVRLQYRAGGGAWRSFKGGNKLSTNSTGILKARYRVNIARDVRVRAVTLGDGIYRPSKSRAIKINVT